MRGHSDDIGPLVAAAQGGDAAAFAALVRRFQDMAVGYAWSLLGDFHLAEDAAQDAFLEAHRCLGQLRHGPAWAGWLRKLVFKHCDRRLRRARLPTVELEAAGPAASAAGDDGGTRLEREEMERHIHQAVLALPEDERRAVALFYFGDRSQAEVADFLGVSVPTVKRYMRSARARLQQQMMQWVGESIATHKPSRDDDYAGRVLRMVAAVSAGDAGEVGRLLREDPRLLHAPGGRWRRPPLHRAAGFGHRAVVELLLARGAAVADVDRLDHATALHWAAGGGQLDVVRMLVELGADPNDRADDHRAGPLGWACCFGQVHREVAAYLLDQGAELDIFSAIALGDAAAVERMAATQEGVLAARMSRNEHGRTPLHYAVDRRQRRIAELLLARGADPRAPDALGAPPLALLCAPKYRLDPEPDEAVKKDWVGLFAGAGVECDAYSAVAMGWYGRAEALWAADPRAGAEAVRVLHFVALAGLVPALSWLLDRGVDPSAPLRVWGCAATPLHFAAEHGLAAVASALLRGGADLDARDDQYDATPLQWAEHCGQGPVAELLRRGG